MARIGMAPDDHKDAVDGGYAPHSRKTFEGIENSHQPILSSARERPADGRKRPGKAAA